MTSVHVSLGSDAYLPLEHEPRGEFLPPQNEEGEHDFLRTLRAEELDRLSKENLELATEVHRLRSQLLQAKSLQEKVDRFERLELSLKSDLARVQGDCESSEQRLEEERQRAGGLEEQLGAAKAREAELLERELAKTQELRGRVKQAEIDSVKFMALSARVAALTEECEEAKTQLEKSDKVRTDLLKALQERNGELEHVRTEMKELREYERSKSAQVAELTKEAAVLQERVKNMAGSLQQQEAATKLAQQDAEDTRKALSKSQEEARVLQKRCGDLEAWAEQLEEEVQRGKTELARRREEQVRLESLASEREVALQLAAKREEGLNDQVAQQQSRADCAQSALLAERAAVQGLQGELHAAKSSAASAQAALARVVKDEEVSRQDLIQRTDKKVAQLQAEIANLEEHLQLRLEELGQRNRDFAELEVQISRAGSRQASLESALEEAHRGRDEARAACAEACRKLHELTYSEKAVMTSRRRFAERGTGTSTRQPRSAAQVEPVAAWRGDASRGAVRRSVSDSATAPGRRLGAGLQERLESSSTFASSSRSDLWQEPLGREPARREVFQEPMTREPVMREVFQEPFAREPATKQLFQEPAAREVMVGEARRRNAPRGMEEPLGAQRRAPAEPVAEPLGAQRRVPAEPVAEPLQLPASQWVGAGEETLGHQAGGGAEPEEPHLASAPEPAAAFPPEAAARQPEEGAPPEIFAVRPSDVVAEEGVEALSLIALPRKPGEELLRPSPEPATTATTLLPAQELLRPRFQAASLDAWTQYLRRLERWQLLSEVWQSWSAPAKVSALRARLELVLLDEMRLTKVCQEARQELRGFLRTKLRSPWEWPEVFGGSCSELRQTPDEPPPEPGSLERRLFVMKSFIFEFRKRVAEAVAELPGALEAASGCAEGQAFQTTLEIGRGSFGRLLNASLFLYQKLRTLVPTELEETMRDPVSRLVPVPFYVLPYKFRLAVHRGVGGLLNGSAPQRGSHGNQLRELQDMLPLCTSPTAVPGFLARLLAVRGLSREEEVTAEPTTEEAAAQKTGTEGWHDGFDQLVVDALTVYMSGWRISNGASAAEVVAKLPAERRGRSAAATAGRPQPRQRPGRELPLGEPNCKLRLGPERC